MTIFKMENKMFTITLLSCILLSWSKEIQSQTIGDNSQANVTSTVIALSCGLVKKSAQDTIERAYAGCGPENSEKNCFGDRVGCVEARTCARMSTLTITPASVHVEFYSKCALETRPGRWGHYFYALAVNETVDVQVTDGLSRVICNTPQKDDFKLLHFWPKTQQKCQPRSENFALEIISSEVISLEGLREKCVQKYQDFTGVVEIPSVFNLTHWIDNNIIVHHVTGSFANQNGSQIASRVDYEVVDGISCISAPYEDEEDISTTSSGETTGSTTPGGTGSTTPGGTGSTTAGTNSGYPTSSIFIISVFCTGLDSIRRSWLE